MPALFPIVVIIAVFVFISAHASSAESYSYRDKSYRSSRKSVERGSGRYEESYDRDRGSRRSSSGRRRDREYDRSRY
ncbi:MAG: hypothetical protein AB8B99_09660 [Phormidesmis sp.]